MFLKNQSCAAPSRGLQPANGWQPRLAERGSDGRTVAFWTISRALQTVGLQIAEEVNDGMESVVEKMYSGVMAEHECQDDDDDDDYRHQCSGAISTAVAGDPAVHFRPPNCPAEQIRYTRPAQSCL